MPEFILSKRKMESYRRAEVVAQAARQYIAAGPRVTQEMLDALVHSTIDWLDVTGKVAFDKPVRRSRIDRNIAIPPPRNETKTEHESGTGWWDSQKSCSATRGRKDG